MHLLTGTLLLGQILLHLNLLVAGLKLGGRSGSPRSLGVGWSEDLSLPPPWTSKRFSVSFRNLGGAVQAGLEGLGVHYLYPPDGWESFNSVPHQIIFEGGAVEQIDFVGDQPWTASHLPSPRFPLHHDCRIGWFRE